MSASKINRNIHLTCRCFIVISCILAGTQVVADDKHWVHEGDLLDAYQRKIKNPEYLKWKSLPGLPKGYQAFKEETEIKVIRAEIAKQLQAPLDAKLIRVPLRRTSVPYINGVLSPAEWGSATRIRLSPEEDRSEIYLLSDGKSLFIGADVPKEKTNSGFDQFRFYYHVKGSPTIVNERVHVGRYRDDILGGIRQTTLRWEGEPAANEDERWKRFAITDWRIYRNARGLSSFKSHRQYEVKLDLDEVGLHVGVPFTAFAEVETDPKYKADGKFEHRRYLGFLGSQGTPVWLIIDAEISKGSRYDVQGNLIGARPNPGATKVYRWVDEQGRVYFSDQEPGN